MSQSCYDWSLKMATVKSSALCTRIVCSSLLTATVGSMFVAWLTTLVRKPDNDGFAVPTAKRNMRTGRQRKRTTRERQRRRGRGSATSDAQTVRVRKEHARHARLLHTR